MHKNDFYEIITHSLVSKGSKFQLCSQLIHSEKSPWIHINNIIHRINLARADHKFIRTWWPFLEFFDRIHYSSHLNQETITSNQQHLFSFALKMSLQLVVYFLIVANLDEMFLASKKTRCSRHVNVYTVIS